MWIHTLLIAITLMPALAHAYIGPGIGLSAIAALLALGSAFFITLFNFVWLPIKRFFNGNNNAADSNEDHNDDSRDEADNSDTDTDIDKPDHKQKDS